MYAKTGTPRTRNYDLLIVTAAAILTLLIHLAWILFVIFGALWTRRRPVWSAIHILALLWGIVVEVSPWPCSLTLAEVLRRHALPDEPDALQRGIQDHRVKLYLSWLRRKRPRKRQR